MLTRKCLQISIAFASLICAVGMARVAWGNESSGAACTGDPNACYSDELQMLITNCIQENQNNPPKGNPGPFTQGYNSLIVLTGQCFGGGMSGLTGIGDDVVVGAAAAADKESAWGYTGPVSNSRYKWLDKLIMEINANPNRPIKDILDAVKMADPDPAAMTPAPSTSAGGAGVTMGNPSETGTKSYHAVLFGGVMDSEPEKEGQNVATQKALDDMEAALRDTLHVPQANIMKKFPGTCAELKMMIMDTWKKMNDNEQFILVLADHGARCITDKEPPVPDEETGGQQSSFDTPSYMDSPNVTDPAILVATQAVFQPGQVRLNGQTIGQLLPSTGPSRRQFIFPPQLLSPVGQPNLVQVTIPFPAAPGLQVSATTGPVAAFRAEIPAMGAMSMGVTLAASLLAGVIVLRGRRREP